MNYYRRYIGDYQRDTMHLSITEHGAYTLLLDAYYSHSGALPRHLSELNRICRATTKSEREAVMKVAQEFFPTNGDGTRHNSRADRELDIALPAIEKMKAGGRDGGLRKWGSGDREKSGKELRGERLALARQKGRHSEKQWVAMVEYHKWRCVKCGADENIVKDHIIPIYQGGSDGIENIQPLCRSCNSAKGPDSTDLRTDGWQQKCLG